MVLTSENMIEVKCNYCKEVYYAIESYIQYGACPDCFKRHYLVNIDGTVRLRDEEFTGNDTSYRKELKPAYQPGKGRPKGAPEDWGTDE